MEKIFPDITSNDEVVERHYFLGKLLSTWIIHLDGVFEGFIGKVIFIVDSIFFWGFQSLF